MIVIANLTFKSNLLPSNDLEYSFGSTTQQWNIYGLLNGNASSATKSGDGGLYLYPENNNELNFGGSNSATDIYIGFRAKDSRSIPTNFIFGGRGTANLTAATFTGVLNGTTKTPSSTKISIAGAYNNTQATLLKSDHIVSLIFRGDFSSIASGTVTLATLPQGYRPPDTVYFSGGNCYGLNPWVYFWIDTEGVLKRYSSSAVSSRSNGGFSITYITLQ